jgi:hypothetical protein
MSFVMLHPIADRGVVAAGRTPIEDSIDPAVLRFRCSFCVILQIICARSRQRFCDATGHLILMEGFVQDANRPGAHQPLLQRRAWQSGHEHDRNPVSKRGQPLQEMFGVAAGHLNIADDASGAVRNLGRQELVGGRESFGQVTHRIDEASDALTDEWIVVYDCDDGLAFHPGVLLCKN